QRLKGEEKSTIGRDVPPKEARSGSTRTTSHYCRFWSTGALFRRFSTHVLRALQLYPVPLRLHSGREAGRVEPSDCPLALPACPRPYLFLRILLTRLPDPRTHWPGRHFAGK